LPLVAALLKKTTAHIRHSSVMIIYSGVNWQGSYLRNLTKIDPVESPNLCACRSKRLLLFTGVLFHTF
jgi:hypothetical protein